MLRTRRAPPDALFLLSMALAEGLDGSLLCNAAYCWRQECHISAHGQAISGPSGSIAYTCTTMEERQEGESRFIG